MSSSTNTRAKKRRCGSNVSTATPTIKKGSSLHHHLSQSMDTLIVFQICAGPVRCLSGVCERLAMLRACERVRKARASMRGAVRLCKCVCVGARGWSKAMRGCMPRNALRMAFRASLTNRVRCARGRHQRVCVRAIEVLRFGRSSQGWQARYAPHEQWRYAFVLGVLTSTPFVCSCHG
jgi:hypothetical protein